MRRLWGPVLLGLGVFLLVAAGMLRFFVAGQLAVTPIDEYARTVAPGQGTYLDAGALQERSGDLVARRTLKADVAASNDSTAVWDVSVVLETGDGTFVRASIDRVATDRKTGEAVNCCGEAVDSQPVRHSGVSYKFPFGTEKKDYQFWDVNSRKAYPAKYVSEEQVQGLTTYKFIVVVQGQQLRTQEVPGSLVGESSATFDAPVWYTDTRTLWIEPKTGVIVKGNEQNKTTLRNSAGEDKVVVVQFDVTFDDASQKSQADLAKDGISKIDLATVWLPLAGLVLGILFVIVGAVIIRSGDNAPPAVTEEVEPEPVDA